MSLIEVKDLTKYFPVKGGFLGRQKGFVQAVDGLTFDIQEGETFGLVGESGCGKTTVARLVLRLIEPTRGKILFLGQDISKISNREMRKFRKEMQIIFQDPFASLNPRKTIRQILIRPFKLHRKNVEENLGEEISDLLEAVGLIPAATYLDRYPHEFSGGQRQRIGIARAIALKPKLIVADEAVSSLDMSIRAQILNLMKQLQNQLKLSYLFITHDLAVVRSLCHRVAVMYLGRIVEISPVDQLYCEPLHPYTKALLSATPIPNPESARSHKRVILKGEVPSPINPPLGCRFHTRCPDAQALCAKRSPRLEEYPNDRSVACHFAHHAH